MKTYRLITLLITLITSTNSYAIHIKIPAGQIMEEAHGEVLTHGKAISYKNDLAKHVNAIKKSKFPKDNEQLARFIENGFHASFESEYGDISIINESLKKAKEAYNNLKEDWASSSAQRAHAIENSNEYLTDHNYIVHMRGVKEKFDKDVAPYIKNQNDLEKEFDLLSKDYISLDNNFINAYNDLIKSETNNSKYLIKKDSKIRLLSKFRTEAPRKNQMIVEAKVVT
ncbi:hypothetical protein [Lacimicrobium sp. SS2-24]|uniref:hypothetical protein n=1 Tax=Lacimicrobium sp. SS2-24 TaxID=2005569 RepID=UPI000B4BD934|nr:hypothetical protein [Lacimicrobium sp. SS2-24]